LGIRPNLPSRVSREVAFAGQREVERIAGVRDRPRRLIAPGRAILRIGEGAITGRHGGAILAAQPVGEQHALHLEAGRIGVGNVVRDHVHGAFLRGHARRCDIAVDVHRWRSTVPSPTRSQAVCHASL
jgi:hypothetical protein